MVGRRRHHSTFFHNVIKDKKKRLTIHKIKAQDGNWVEGTPQVADAAIKFFSHLFKAEPIEEDNYVLNVKERMVTNEDNDNLTSLPTLQEIKDTIFSIDPDSAPDGLNGKFYQSAWQIIENDIHAAIISLFQGRKILEIFTDMICKITNRIKGCHLKPFSSGGRATLIRHVLLALNVHTLAVGHPPKGTLEMIETYLTKFYWSGNKEGRKYDWISWENLSYPYNERGSNFRKLVNTYKSFTAKQWWKFRTTDSLWTNFLNTKYESRNGNFAQLLWSTFAGRMGIITRNTNLRDLLHKYWNCTSKNHVATYVLKILPPILMWELWRSRCSSRYDEERPSITRSTYQISFNICHLTKKIFPNLDIPDDWEKFLKLMETNFVGTTSFPIKWIRPSSPFVKMNSDGTCVRNSSGGGGIVRDSNGNCIMAFILPLGNGTSNTAEASAFLFGLKWCIDNGYNNITGETDSLLLQNCIQKFWSSPWRIR
ncbi:hypothetical protein MTR67_013077 [Solanum verrucosum]|uniref:RNase H type-1 domain-containing protein n=1 Tax=Solanum verrucosum TaxID=315347 RepID=A0AAF0Q9X0_SOLVR|nr:hypothetical protein MTR67_013077 [Solanum verrucosum]